MSSEMAFKAGVPRHIVVTRVKVDEAIHGQDLYVRADVKVVDQVNQREIVQPDSEHFVVRDMSGDLLNPVKLPIPVFRTGQKGTIEEISVHLEVWEPRGSIRLQGDSTKKRIILLYCEPFDLFNKATGYCSIPFSKECALINARNEERAGTIQFSIYDGTQLDTVKKLVTECNQIVMMRQPIHFITTEYSKQDAESGPSRERLYWYPLLTSNLEVLVWKVLNRRASDNLADAQIIGNLLRAKEEQFGKRIGISDSAMDENVLDKDVDKEDALQVDDGLPVNGPDSSTRAGAVSVPVVPNSFVGDLVVPQGVEWSHFMNAFLADRHTQSIGGTYSWTIEGVRALVDSSDDKKRAEKQLSRNVKKRKEDIHARKWSALNEKLRVNLLALEGLLASLHKAVKPLFPKSVHYTLYAGYMRDKDILKSQMLDGTTAEERSNRRLKPGNMRFDKPFILLETERVGRCIICEREMPNFASVIAHLQNEHRRLDVYCGNQRSLTNAYIGNKEIAEVDIFYKDEEMEEERKTLLCEQSVVDAPVRTVSIDTTSMEMLLQSWRQGAQLPTDSVMYVIHQSKEINKDLVPFLNALWVLDSDIALTSEAFTANYVTKFYDPEDVLQRSILFSKFWNRFVAKFELTNRFKHKILVFKYFVVTHKAFVEKYGLMKELLGLFRMFSCADETLTNVYLEEILYMFGLNEEQLQTFLQPEYPLNIDENPVFIYLRKLGEKDYEKPGSAFEHKKARLTGDFYARHAYRILPDDSPLKCSTEKLTAQLKGYSSPKWIMQCVLPRE